MYYEWMMTLEPLNIPCDQMWLICCWGTWLNIITDSDEIFLLIWELWKEDQFRGTDINITIFISSERMSYFVRNGRGWYMATVKYVIGSFLLTTMLVWDMMCFKVVNIKVTVFLGVTLFTCIDRYFSTKIHEATSQKTVIFNSV